MTREAFEEHILKLYGISADYPFEEDLITGVFRHKDNKKWFALVMNIPATRLGLDLREKIDVANLKCPPEVIESIIAEGIGVYPAYHMNKLHWISVLLGECDDETILWLLDISYTLTAANKTKRYKK